MTFESRILLQLAPNIAKRDAKPNLDNVIEYYNQILILTNELLKGNNFIDKLNIIFNTNFTVVAVDKYTPAIMSDVMTSEQYAETLKLISPQLWLYFWYYNNRIIINPQHIPHLINIQPQHPTDHLDPLDISKLKNYFIRYSDSIQFKSDSIQFEIDLKSDCIVFLKGIRFYGHNVFRFADIGKLINYIEDSFPITIPTNTCLFICLENYIKERYQTCTQLVNNTIATILYMTATSELKKLLSDNNIHCVYQDNVAGLSYVDALKFYKELWRTNPKIQSYHCVSIQSTQLPSDLINLIIEYTMFGPFGDRPPLEKFQALPVGLPALVLPSKNKIPLMPPFPPYLKRRN